MAADPTPSAPETVPEPPTDAVADTSPDVTTASPYVTKLWHDLPLYVCPACGYDTLLLARIDAHQGTCQALAQARQTQPGPLGASPDPDDHPASDTEAVVTPPGEEA